MQTIGGDLWRKLRLGLKVWSERHPTVLRAYERRQRDLCPMVVSAKLRDDVVEGSDPSDDRSQRGDGRDGRCCRADASGPSETVE